MRIRDWLREFFHGTRVWLLFWACLGALIGGGVISGLGNIGFGADIERFLVGRGLQGRPEGVALGAAMGAWVAVCLRTCYWVFATPLRGALVCGLSMAVCLFIRHLQQEKVAFVPEPPLAAGLKYALYGFLGGHWWEHFSVGSSVPSSSDQTRSV
jgi:hypothetical protein